MAKAEHREEECLQRAKSEAGLADYKVRTWEGWHHHQTLSLIATWFLVKESLRGKKWTPAITVPQIRWGIALLLQRALDCDKGFDGIGPVADSAAKKQGSTTGNQRNV